MSILQGLCAFNNRLYAAWKGEVGDDRLFFATFDGSNWQPGNVHIPGNSSVGPSLASPNPSALYAAWKGEHGDGDQRLFYSSFNGSSWSPQVQIAGVASSIGPALGVWNGVLYAAWKGEEGDTKIYWSQLNGSTWSPQQIIPGATSAIGPSLTEYNGLFAGWLGLDGGLHFAQFDGHSWHTAPSIPGGPSSTIGPSLAAVGGSLYAAWKGEGNDQGIYYATLTSGVWTGQNNIAGVGSSIGPALAAYGTTLYAMWKREGADQSLYYASFNGTWSGQNPLPGNSGQDDVPPPGTGLTSNSNYLFGSGNCENLLNPTVTIAIAEDLVVAPGITNFGFQLNCYSPQNAKVVWQQYLIVPHFDTQELNCGCQQYGLGSVGQLYEGPPAASLGTVVASQRIPAKWSLTFALLNDTSDNITGVTFTLMDNTVSPPRVRPYQLNLYDCTLDAGGGKVTIEYLAPIVSFQLNIVGPAGSPSTAVFESGAGTITYSAQNPLTALPFVPSCSAISNPTAEVSDSYYSMLPAGPQGTFTQGFGVRKG